MQFLIFVLLICLFVFLYCIYLLANDDFVFLRRDLTMERLFNIIFLGSLSSLFFARLFYGLFHTNNILFNPFVFLLFPYFPGLSLLGGALGIGISFLFLANNKKNQLPLERLSDFSSVAFLISLPIGILGFFMLSEDGFSVIKAGSLAVTYLILFVLFLRFLLPKLLNGILKEGTITLIFLICFSIINLISHISANFNFKNYLFNLENIILFLIFLVSLVLLTIQEKLLEKIKKR